MTEEDEGALPPPFAFFTGSHAHVCLRINIEACVKVGNKAANIK